MIRSLIVGFILIIVLASLVGCTSSTENSENSSKDSNETTEAVEEEASENSIAKEAPYIEREDNILIRANQMLIETPVLNSDFSVYDDFVLDVFVDDELLTSVDTYERRLNKHSPEYVYKYGSRHLAIFGTYDIYKRRPVKFQVNIYDTEGIMVATKTINSLMSVGNNDDFKQVINEYSDVEYLIVENSIDSIEGIYCSGYIILR